MSEVSKGEPTEKLSQPSTSNAHRQDASEDKTSSDTKEIENRSSDESTKEQRPDKDHGEDIGESMKNPKALNSSEADETKRNETFQLITSSASPASSSAGDWQAIWSPAHNAYYFYNARSGETTWVNPLQPNVSDSAAVASSSSSAISSTSAMSTTESLHAAAEAAGIDPSLAYLDPSLVMPGSTPGGTFAAKFNARTGAFTRMDARDPSHLSEAERAKRMSAVYFDVGEWEKEIEERAKEEDATGKKRKRPTKKDLERFKEQKKQKKIAKTAWLRT